MLDTYHDFHQILTRYISLSDDEWNAYSSLLKAKSVRKKSILHFEGSICKEVYFIRKGLLRIYFMDKEGNEKTFHFAPENTFVTDYESLLKQIPAHYSIQALEDSELLIMPETMISYGYEHLRYGEQLGRLLAEEYFLIFSDKVRSIYTLTPIERYSLLKQMIPTIFQRVAQHYIASYLNISPVHLSRLKSQNP